MIGDYEGCVAAADFAGDLNPNVPGWKTAALYHLGRKEQAAAELERFFAVVRARWSVQEDGDAGRNDALAPPPFPDRETRELGTPARRPCRRRRAHRRTVSSSMVNRSASQPQFRIE
jgi:hypothetical protein